MPLVRLQVRNEFGLGQPEHYKEASREDLKAVLDGVAVAGLVGIWRQLGDLADLVQLRKLKIDDCKLIAEIVTNKGEVEGNRITMKKLEYFELTGLTNLKTFCSHNHAFEFPSLIEVTVKGCPKINMFCPGVLVTPILEGVLIEEDEVRWKDNLNKTIQQLFTEKDGQNSIEG